MSSLKSPRIIHGNLYMDTWFKIVECGDQLYLATSALANNHITV